ncbi:MAG: hypothetical protein MJ239_03445 [Bacilli bacterium]|nr:hypothetical protein [Bacilli bacterium]
MKKIFYLGFALAALSFAIAPENKASKYEAEKDDFSYIKLNDTYRLGEEIAIPGALIEADGQTFNARHLLTYPSGKRSYANTVKLDEAGSYVLEYYFVKDGKYYSEKEGFTVTSPFYKLGKSSSAYYGLPEESGTKGLIVSLAAGESIEFSQTISLKSLTKSNRFIESYVYPMTRGNEDFTSLVFTLSNPNDESEYVRFRVNSSPSERLYPTLADVSMQGNGTDYIGRDAWNTSLIHHNDGDGTKINFSFRGITPGQNVTVDPVTGKKTEVTVERRGAPIDSTKLLLDFDYESKQAYTYYSYFSSDGTVSSIYGAGQLLIADLDDSEFTGSRSWGGFSCDYVKLSVSAGRYSGESARFVISEVNGIDLSSTEVKDVTSPTISFSSLKDENMPIGKVNLPYPVPEASAFDDIDGETPLNVNVWKNYGKANASNVEIKDGYFVPTQEGEYTIEYTSLDNANNEGKKLLKVFVSDDIDPIVISINESQKKLNAYLGETLVLPEASYSGGSGDLDLTIYAKNGDYVETIGTNKEFVPEIQGNWTIEYTVVDFLGETKTESYTINVSKSPLPILSKKFFGDKHIVSYCDYAIPDAPIVDYVDGKKVAVDYDVDVTFGGATTRYKKGQSVYFGNVENNSKAKFEYSVDGNVITSFEAALVNPFSIGKYDAKALEIDRYFMSENASFEFEEPKITSPEQEIGAKMVSLGEPITGFEFPNYLLSENFMVKFSTFDGHDSYSSVDLVLSDSIDKENSVTINIGKNEKGYLVTLPGKDPVFVKAFGTEAYQIFNVEYSNGYIDVFGTRLAISENDLGYYFGGFDSKKVAFKVVVDNMKKDDYLMINEIGNHTMAKSSKNLNDYTVPQVNIRKDFSGSHDLGDNLVTSIADVQDVLAFNSVVTVTVTDSKTGEIIKDINGLPVEELDASIEYEIPFDGYAEYNVTYMAHEVGGDSKYWQNENVAEDAYIAFCVDMEAPVITFTSFMNETCSVGDVLALATFNVKDNSKDALTINRHMEVPSGRITNIDGNAKSYRFTEKGTYRYLVSARDAFGNIGMNSMTITVK